MFESSSENLRLSESNLVQNDEILGKRLLTTLDVDQMKMCSHRIDSEKNESETLILISSYAYSKRFNDSALPIISQMTTTDILPLGQFSKLKKKNCTQNVMSKDKKQNKNMKYDNKQCQIKIKRFNKCIFEELKKLHKLNEKDFHDFLKNGQSLFRSKNFQQFNCNSDNFSQQNGLSVSIPQKHLKKVKKSFEQEKNKEDLWWKSTLNIQNQEKSKKSNPISLKEKKSIYQRRIGTNHSKIPKFYSMFDNFQIVWVNFMCDEKLNQKRFGSLCKNQKNILVSYLVRKKLFKSGENLTFDVLELIQQQNSSMKELEMQRIVLKSFNSWFMKTVTSQQLRIKGSCSKITIADREQFHFELMFKESFGVLKNEGYIYKKGRMWKEGKSIALDINKVQENKKKMRVYLDMFKNHPKLKNEMKKFLKIEDRTSPFLSQIKSDICNKIKKKIEKFRDFLQDLEVKHLDAGFKQIHIDNENNSKSKFPVRYIDAKKAGEYFSELIFSKPKCLVPVMGFQGLKNGPFR